MMKILKLIIWPVFFILLIVNVFIFVKSIDLGNDINYFEKEIKQIHQKNTELANQTYRIDSLQYTASVAAEFEFTQQAKAIYLDNLKYAFNR